MPGGLAAEPTSGGLAAELAPGGRADGELAVRPALQQAADLANGSTAA